MKSDLFEPGYRSAYGLVMIVHQRVVERADATLLVDEGVRAHGSVSYASILRGESHGCHRLFNHLALRLAGFVLAHRRFVARGPSPVRFVRDFAYRGQRFRVALSTRGYLYQLDPPVGVEVLEGSTHGHRPRIASVDPALSDEARWIERLAPPSARAARVAAP